jgi:hypothetical protein
LNVKKETVAIIQGMQPFPGYKNGQMSSGDDYSYIVIRGIEDRLAITGEVVDEYVNTIGFQPILSDMNNTVALMNIALRHRQYIKFEEV